MMEHLQTLLVVGLAAGAVRFLYLKFIKKKDKDCGPDCGCH
ncbi:MAG: hypothetical protein ACPH63_01255 [Flavobacteriaceae bacterium]